jgi:hypothetical protein
VAVNQSDNSKEANSEASNDNDEARRRAGRHSQTCDADQKTQQSNNYSGSEHVIISRIEFLFRAMCSLNGLLVLKRLAPEKEISGSAKEQQCENA